MTAPSGKVLARRDADELCFLVVGHVTCHHSPALRQHADEELARGATKIKVDLQGCTYCDSTFLGTLVQLKRRAEGHDPEAFRLVRPSAEFRKVLSQMGAERLFCIVDDAATNDMQTTWLQLKDDVDRAGALRFKQIVVDAHQELANAGGALGTRFGPLAEALRSELEVQRSEHPEPKPS